MSTCQYHDHRLVVAPRSIHGLAEMQLSVDAVKETVVKKVYVVVLVVVGVPRDCPVGPPSCDCLVRGEVWLVGECRLWKRMVLDFCQ